ncbi:MULTISPECIES: rpa-associated protein [Haloferax]|uniref:Rpa-associated protein n=1 Tax=Haloferax marinum TaxID=2666143 RepID=A0A6A8G3F9_9EURY|nr:MULTISPECIES: rpa-associated protein [Haloferax]KAB1196433.1 rpa-associated protein [Haloferax sp. CBA1150]MRW95429.1 rpa-associated protein [Haloferax marinum]
MSSSPVVGTREVAYRVFAAEFDDASLSYSESDEERAPNYVVTPTGARLNRTFVAGALTEVEHVNDEVLRGRIADPTGAFITYAGQYQPEPMAFLDQATPPAFVALAGKARTYKPDDSDVVYTSIRPESVNTIDADVRDRWLVTTAEATLHRIAVFDEALSMPQRGDELRRHLEARGVESTLAAGIPRAIDHYGTTRSYLEAVRALSVQALELVAGERDQVENLTVAPDDEGDATLGALPELDLRPADSVDVEPAAEERPAEATSAEAEADAEESVESDQPEPADEVVSETADAESNATADSTEPADSEPVAAEATTVGATESEPAPETETPAEPDESTEPSTTDVETTQAESEPEPQSEPEPTFSDEPAAADDDSEPVESDTPGTLGDFDDDGADETSSFDDELDDLGDFDDDLPDIEDEVNAEGAADASDATTSTADSEDESTDPSAMYEMDEEERAEIESEFGTEFTSGSEVDPAGEADIDVPDVDEVSEQVDEDVADSDAETVADEAPVADEPEPEEVTDDTDTDTDSTGGDTPAEDIDLESVVVEAMEGLDDGDGAAHDDVVAAVVDEYGADVGAVEDAIQDALLGGRCYEPQDDVLKAI